ncbi:unnamed protein product [Clonostachys rhizophaga]|uniref:Sugar phosphate transporter domain-containing protein n=1 Tax=Clonostachys rhizophaga TaxID=160324 RepID=A0A9N9VTV2_9HYPO|nr:unnamed protein product [Clonostachys rhizophaga]
MEKETPTPPVARSKAQIPAYIIAWIVTSNTTILANKWLISSGGFAILLTCLHLTFASIVTQVLARTTNLLHRRHTLPMDRNFFLRTILPMGIVASGSLVCSNLSLVYLSVSFQQMVKGCSPVLTLFVSWLLGVRKVTKSDIFSVTIIAGGVILASAGEVHFSVIGVVYQLAGLLFEATRVVLIQLMLTGEEVSLDPIVGLYYYAPFCALLNFCIMWVVEVPHLSVGEVTPVTWAMLLGSAVIAFMLNYTSMALIGKTSGLTTTLVSIFKNILLVGVSVLIWSTPISPIQFLGYSISLIGLVLYSFGFGQLNAGCRSLLSWLGLQWKDEAVILGQTLPTSSK